MKTSHKEFLLVTLEKLTKECLVRLHVFMNNSPVCSGDVPIMAIEYNYRSQKVPGFIAMEGGGSTVPGVPYLSSYPGNYSNVYIHPILCPNIICRNLISFNAIYNHNRMWNCDLALEKYWVTQSGYFSFATTVALGVGIIDGKILFCHGISENQGKEDFN